MNIFEKMSKATEQIEKVAKKLKIEMGGNRSYKAVSEADVLEAVKPIESELGIYSYPIDREVIETDVLVSTKTYNGQTSETKQLFMRLKVIYRFVNVEKPDEFIDIATFGDGIDSGDKAPGKAMTYADKYALLKAYKIETGDDPDKEASNNLKSKQGKFKQEEKLKNPTDDIFITESQVKQIFTLSKGNTEVILPILTKYGYTKGKEIRVEDFNKICTEVSKAAKGD